MESWVTHARQLLLKAALHKNACALTVITLVVLAGNIVFVSGLRDPNPLLQYSGLATSISGRLAQGGYTIDNNIAFTTQTLGKAAASQLLHGHMPYWNHYEGLGTPLIGEMQSAALLPTTLLLALPNGVLLEHMVLEVVAGYFTYLFIKRLGLRFKVAVLAAVMFSLNGTFAWIANAAFNPIAFLPMMLFGVEAFFIENAKTRSWLWLPVGLALSLYAGFPETAFLDALLVVLWALARLWQSWSKTTRWQVIRLCSSFILGVLLATPVLVPFADYLLHADVGQHSAAFAYTSLSFMSLPVHIFPYVYGTIGNAIPATSTWDGIGGYISITVAFLAVIGLFSRMNIKIKVLVALWIVACGLKAFGFRPAEDIWNLIPTIKNAAFYRYCIPSVYFACTLLAAYGLQDVLGRTMSRTRLLCAYAVFGIVFVFMVLLVGHYWHLLAAVPGHKYFAVVWSLWWAATMALLLAAAIVVVKSKYIYQTIFLLVSADVALMFLIPTLSTPTVAIDMAPVRYLQSNLGTSRFYTLGPIQPNYGSYFNIAEVNTNDLPAPKAWTGYLTKNLDTNTGSILFTGVDRANASGPSAFDEFLRNEKNFEYIATKYLVTTHDQLSNNQTTAAELTKKYSNKAVDIYQLPNVAPYYQATGGCSIKDESINAAMVNCNSNGSIIRKELYMPGWSVTANGKLVALHEHNATFQSLDLKKGTYNLKFTFSSPYSLYSWLVFAAALFFVVYGLFAEKLQNALGYIRLIINKQDWVKR